MLYADNKTEMIVHVLYIHENHCIIRDSDAARTGTVDVYIMCILCVYYVYIMCILCVYYVYIMRMHACPYI